MVQGIWRSGLSMKNRLLSAVKSSQNLDCFLENLPSKSVSEAGICGFSAIASEKAATDGILRRELVKSGFSWNPLAANPVARVINEAGVGRIIDANFKMPCLARSFASKATEPTGEKQSESQKDISTFEDPFDAPTYNIPEKPVTFTEGASYSVVILAGLAIAAAAAYAVFTDLIFEPKEYKIFGKALERVQTDSQVRVRIGSPITGYGSESRNRAARQRIPKRIWTDEDGVEHVEVNFYIRGPHGAGKVFTEMFQDKVDKQWKFTYLIVQITSPSPAQLMLESYVPA